ncbi:nuclear ribonuclease [Plasmopara halstedii]|uniref:Nuclear ribonuclease n=1 Tax=Plasmopara halstedii TaxID=4781 RepID=A0A0P1AJE1_PLAHL|nr:nuclear ribonuclease [Plasmopara halstedii]CEG41325.1 nuclear ribonuclease [Plasmopara halstedii]|eukprot:XP_024577694.1 nuclear ribonuclease [Plasmopara halstedii]
MSATVVNAGKYTLHVRCVAGVESCCYVDSIDIAFDLGCIIGRVVNKSNIFITHGHVDHIGAVVAHAARRSLQKQKAASYFVPAYLVAHLEDMLNNMAVMQGDIPFPAKFVPLQAFDEVNISSKYMVRAVPTKHRVPSLGYILYERKSCLKPELRHMFGDTTIEVFTTALNDNRSKDLLQVKILITEATYVDSKMNIEDAAARGHIHLDQLAAHENLFQDVGILVLVHFSARYCAEELHQCIRTRFPVSLQQKTFLGCQDSHVHTAQSQN